LTEHNVNTEFAMEVRIELISLNRRPRYIRSCP